MGAEKASLVFTDPPYGVSIGTKNRELIEAHGNAVNAVTEDIENDTLAPAELRQLLTACFTNVYAFMADDCSYYVTAPQGALCWVMWNMLADSRLTPKNMLIWAKQQSTFSLGRLDYPYRHEPILYGWKKTRNFYGLGKYTESVWYIDRPQKSPLHPTMKPPALIKNAIRNSLEPVDKAENAIVNSTMKKDLILDPFAGSGSTLIAAEDCKRRAYLIEKDPRYCDVIVNRALEVYPGLKAFVERDGETREVTAADFPKLDGKLDGN
jgi:DNA modification methylase